MSILVAQNVAAPLALPDFFAAAQDEPVTMLAFVKVGAFSSSGFSSTQIMLANGGTGDFSLEIRNNGAVSQGCSAVARDGGGSVLASINWLPENATGWKPCVAVFRGNALRDVYSTDATDTRITANNTGNRSPSGAVDLTLLATAWPNSAIRVAQPAFIQSALTESEVQEFFDTGTIAGKTFYANWDTETDWASGDIADISGNNRDITPPAGWTYSSDNPSFASAEPSVNPTGTDVVLTVGAAAEISMQNMGGATATALTLRYTNGPLVVNTVQADFDYTAADADTGTIDFTATRGNLPYGSAGYQYVITLSAGDPIVYSATSLTPAVNEFVVADDPVSDETGIIYQVVSGTPSNGDQIDWQESQSGFTLLIRANFTFAATSVTFPESAIIPFNYWNSTTGALYAMTADVAFSEDGEGTVTGIAERRITLRGITMRNITARLT